MLTLKDIEDFQEINSAVYPPVLSTKKLFSALQKKYNYRKNTEKDFLSLVENDFQNNLLLLSYLSDYLQRIQLLLLSRTNMLP